MAVSHNLRVAGKHSTLVRHSAACISREAQIACSRRTAATSRHTCAVPRWLPDWPTSKACVRCRSMLHASRAPHASSSRCAFSFLQRAVQRDWLAWHARFRLAGAVALPVFNGVVRVQVSKLSEHQRFEPMATVIDTAVEYSMCDGCSSHLAESFAPPTAGGPAAACRLCRLPILERFFLQIDNDSWHESCAQCSCCHVQLEQACFVKNRQLFCRDDYYR